jgi:hypothetical protein
MNRGREIRGGTVRVVWLFAACPTETPLTAPPPPVAAGLQRGSTATSRHLSPRRRAVARAPRADDSSIDVSRPPPPLIRGY